MDIDGCTPISPLTVEDQLQCLGLAGKKKMHEVRTLNLNLETHGLSFINANIHESQSSRKVEPSNSTDAFTFTGNNGIPLAMDPFTNRTTVMATPRRFHAEYNAEADLRPLSFEGSNCETLGIATRKPPKLQITTNTVSSAIARYRKPPHLILRKVGVPPGGAQEAFATASFPPPPLASPFQYNNAALNTSRSLPDAQYPRFYDSLVPPPPPPLIRSPPPRPAGTPPLANMNLPISGYNPALIPRSTATPPLEHVTPMTSQLLLAMRAPSGVPAYQYPSIPPPPPPPPPAAWMTRYHGRAASMNMSTMMRTYLTPGIQIVHE